MLQSMQQRPRARFLLRVVDPDFRQALVWRQFSGDSGQVLALNARFDAFHTQRICP